MNKNFKETSGSGAIAWLLQRLSAVILFILVIYHFVYYHFVRQGSFKWSEVVTAMQSPWFNLVQFTFLLTGLYHGINGIWMVTEDYIHGKMARMIIYSLLWLFGVSLLFVGTLTIMKISGLNVAALKAGV